MFVFCFSSIYFQELFVVFMILKLLESVFNLVYSLFILVLFDI